MALKRGQNVGDRYIRPHDEQEILELMIAGTADNALTADQALAASK
jgi:simple sugar transport system ATP-binding protein